MTASIRSVAWTLGSPMPANRAMTRDRASPLLQDCSASILAKFGSGLDTCDSRASR